MALYYVKKQSTFDTALWEVVSIEATEEQAWRFRDSMAALNPRNDYAVFHRMSRILKTAAGVEESKREKEKEVQP